MYVDIYLLSLYIYVCARQVLLFTKTIIGYRVAERTCPNQSFQNVLQVSRGVKFASVNSSAVRGDRLVYVDDVTDKQ